MKPCEDDACICDRADDGSCLGYAVQIGGKTRQVVFHNLEGA